MCIICVSPKGAPQPDTETLITMYINNPDGAGYMVARNNKVEIHKAFTNLNEFINAVESENFTDEDAVVYHFRISTQAHNPNMTHPFPITANNKYLKAWDLTAEMGVAHNGIIQLTSNGNTEYSDTALYIRNYISKYISKPQDITTNVLNRIEKEAGGRLAFLDKYGNVYMTGSWTYEHGIFYSNGSYRYNYITNNNVKNAFRF